MIFGNILSIILVLLGTYLLSRQIFIQIIRETCINNLLQIRKYSEIPLLLRCVGFIYGINEKTWRNFGMFGQDSSLNRKLNEFYSPFLGFLLIFIASLIQIFCQVYC